MKTKEFIKKVKELGFNVEISREDVLIKRDGCILAMISKTSPYTMSTYTAFKVKHADELLDLCVEYVKTPVEEREEEEKFYLKKMKSFYEARKDEESMFLTLVINYNFFLLSGMRQCQNYQTQFTQKEIDKIKEEQHTDLSEFKQIPVEDIEEYILNESTN